MPTYVKVCQTCAHWDLANAKTVSVPPNTWKQSNCDVTNTIKISTATCGNWKQRT